MTEKNGDVGPEPAPPADEPQKVFDADYVKELRGEAAEWRKKFRDLEKQFETMTAQQAEAKQKELVEQGKYKELADEALAKVKELEPLKAVLENYQTTLGHVLEAQKAGVPDSIKTLLEKLDPVDQLEWLAKNHQAAAPEPAGPAKLQNFNPLGGEPVKRSDRDIIAELRRDMGQGGGLFG